MPSHQDLSQQLVERVKDAAQQHIRLRIHGGGSKEFYGRTPRGEPLDVSGHTGIVNYEPTELVLTARSGTPLTELAVALRKKGQMMPFDPPCFDAAATLGGAISSGLAGPGRPWAGSARDLVLGTRLINGRGELMRFGGEVMKNVAGYDVSRVVTGALGTLGIITEVSMKVLPRPEVESTLLLALPRDEAINKTEGWFLDGLPVTAAAHDGQHLHLRLSGARSAVKKGIDRCGGDVDPEGAAWWASLRDHQLAFFTDEGPPLWRISLPPLTPELDLPGTLLHDWNGQLRWLRTEASALDIRHAAATYGGHATAFRGCDREGDVFHPLPSALMQLHHQLKAAFDPAGLFNPGRLFADL